MGMEQSEQMVLTDMLEMFQSMLLPLVGISLVGIAASIILAFCVYYDARARRDNMAVLWAVLSGFFQIAALVYVIARCVSKPKWMPCTRCGQWVAPNATFCASCGAPLTVNGHTITQQEIDTWQHRSKVLLIVWICMEAIIVIGSIVFALWFVSDILGSTQTWVSYY